MCVQHREVIIACLPIRMKRKQGMEHALLLATSTSGGVVKLVVTLAGHGQLVKSMTPTESLSIRLSAVSHAGNSKQEGKGLLKSCCFVQSRRCFMQGWKEI